MAPEKDPPRQGKREKADVSRHDGRVSTGEPLRDSDLVSEHQADLNRDAERVFGGVDHFVHDHVVPTSPSALLQVKRCQ